MCVQLIQRLLLHILRVQKLKLISECIVVSPLQFLNQVESLHLNERLLQINVHMVQIRLQNECIEEAIGTGLEVGVVVVRQTKVDNGPHVVRTKVDRQFVGSDALMGLEELGAGGAVLVPERMVQGVFLDTCSEVLLSLCEVALKELKHAQSQQDLDIGRVLSVCSSESVLDLDVVQVLAQIVGQLLVLRVILEPLVHVAESVLFRQLVRKTDPERQQTVQIVWVFLMSLLKG